MPVCELLRKLPASEFHEWSVYQTLEPFGEWRADLRAGIVASTFASAHRRKGSRQPKPKDFMPTFGEKTVRRQSVSEQRAIFEQANIGLQKLFEGGADG